MPALREGKSGVPWACEEGAERGREAPTIRGDYVRLRSEQEKEEEKGMPIIVAEDTKSKMIAAKVVPSDGC